MTGTHITQPIRRRGGVSRPLLYTIVLYLTFVGGSFYTEASFIPHMFHQAAMTALLGAWLVRRWRRGAGWPNTPLDWPLLAYGAVMAASALLGVSPRVSLEQAWTQLVHVLLFYFFVDVMRQGRARWVFEALFLGGGLVVILSAIELLSWYFGLPLLVADFPQGWPQIGAGLLPPTLHRLSLAMNNPNLVAGFAAPLAALAAAWALTARQRDLRQGAWGLAGALAAVVLLTQSRGGWMSLGVASALLAGFWLLRRFGASWVRALMRPRVLALLAIVAVVALVLGGGVFVRLFGTRGSGDAGRVDMWRSAAEIVHDHPVLGVGPYMFGSTLRTYRDPELVITLQRLMTAHQLYLNVAAELGLAGLAVMGWLAAAFVRAWWRRWRNSDTRQRVRLEACLAALVGVGVQGLVDVFTLTPLVLPLLICAAYVTSGGRKASNPGRVGGRLGLALAGLLVAGYAVAFVPLNVGMFNLLSSRSHMSQGDLEGALQAAGRAASADPGLDLYDAQSAYILGRRAKADPAYLDRAIAAHEAFLVAHPTFELGHANLGALYAQRGDMVAAVAALEDAVAIHPKDPAFWVALGAYREETGEDGAALDAYVEALALNPELADSGFWRGGAVDGPRAAAVPAAIASTEPVPALEIALAANDMESARAVIERAGDAAGWRWETALGRYYHAAGDTSQAIELLQAAAGAAVPDWKWKPYVYLAEVYADTGAWDEAERAARKALFFDVGGVAARANDVLARAAVEAGDWDRAEAYLQAAVPARSIYQYFTVASYGASYGQLASFDYLPQLKAPGSGRRAYEPWLRLAARYVETDRFEDADYVYQVIAQNDPYLAEEMQALRDALPIER
jgi:putative inorganic carbon (HCO3(-)) transporter